MKSCVAFSCLILLLIVYSDVQSQSSKKTQRPEPQGWYTGDMHVHRNCGNDSVTDVSQLKSMMEVNNLDVISVLADMGNGEVKFSEKDLMNVNGKPAAESSDNKIVNWDVEWHWDATYSQFAKQALGGHLVLLGLNNAKQIWEESPYKILDWGRKQNAVSGFAHMEYLNDSVQTKLNCCIPIDYPVEAALGMINFISEDVFGATSPNNGNYYADGAISAYYKLLNCGFRLALVAGTDYPCNDNEPLGTLLTYVNVPEGKLTYQKWVEGIRQGKTVVSRNAHHEFLDLSVNDTKGPGDTILLDKRGGVNVSVTWSADQELSGTVEIVQNGKVIASLNDTLQTDSVAILAVNASFFQSGWICARRMSPTGHMVHTSAVYVSVKNKPVRASVADADYFISWINNIIASTKPGADWNKYFPETYTSVAKRYSKALGVYKKIRKEAVTAAGR